MKVALNRRSPLKVVLTVNTLSSNSSGTKDVAISSESRYMWFPLWTFSLNDCESFWNSSCLHSNNDLASWYLPDSSKLRKSLSISLPTENDLWFSDERKHALREPLPTTECFYTQRLFKKNVAPKKGDFCLIGQSNLEFHWLGLGMVAHQRHRKKCFRMVKFFKVRVFIFIFIFFQNIICYFKFFYEKNYKIKNT